MVAKEGTGVSASPQSTRSHYRDFGEAIGTPKDDVGYTGHKFDTDLGLSYMQARYYDPVIGRFYSNDPIGFRDIHSFNRYAYANNNPYKYVDPDGKLSVDAVTAKAYPKAAAYVNNKTITSTKKIAAFKTYGYASPLKVMQAFNPNKGLGVKGAETFKSEKAWGYFTPGENSQHITIDNSLFADFENGLEGAKGMLDRVIEHEATHYFEDQSTKTYDGEEGTAYEIEVYGGVVQSRAEAARKSNNGTAKGGGAGGFTNCSGKGSGCK
nr:RHS repeat-associated core domain-containing protein [Colwellia sp. E2M01]